MSDISPSSIKTDAALNEAISKASSQADVLEACRQAAINQGLVRPDVYDPNVLLEVSTPTPQKFARTVTVNGQKHILEADSPLELEKAETAFYRAQLTPTATQDAAQPRGADGKFVSQDADIAAQQELLRRTELELQFKRGEIDTATFLSESRAVESFLESKGFHIEDLRAAAQEKQDNQIRQSWESSTNAFLQAHPEWGGGKPALEEIGRTIERLGLVDSPSVESIEAAYADMKRRNAVPANPEVELQNKIANARTPEELRAALGRNTSTMFGGL